MSVLKKIFAPSRVAGSLAIGLTGSFEGLRTERLTGGRCRRADRLLWRDTQTMR